MAGSAQDSCAAGFRDQELDESIHAVVEAIGRELLNRAEPPLTLPVEGERTKQENALLGSTTLNPKSHFRLPPLGGEGPNEHGRPKSPERNAVVISRSETGRGGPVAQLNSVGQAILT